MILILSWAVAIGMVYLLGYGFMAMREAWYRFYHKQRTWL